METAPIAPSARRRANVILVIIFVGLLWLPTVDYFCGLDHSEPTGENRLPARFPDRPRARLADLQTFLAGAEAYFNDHFGFRNRLVRWFMHLKLHLFQDRSVYKVVVGRNGWLYWGELQMVDHFLGLARFSPPQLESWRLLLERRRDWLARQGIQYLVVIPPDKQTVYPDQVPAWLANAVPPHRETKLDQFLAYLHAHSTVEILDLRPALIEARNEAPTYLLNDSHWNSFGGFVACQELIKTLSRRLPGLPPLNLADFQWTNAPFTGGDLAQMIGLADPEKNYFRFQPGPTLPGLHTNGDLTLKTAWGMARVLTVENPGSLPQSAVIFHDSFGLAWQQFLGYDFKRVVFEYENHDFNRELIRANSPTVVVNEMLERYFNTHDPDEMLAKDALP